MVSLHREQPGIVHERHVTGSGRASARHPAFRWANTVLANVKNSLVATHRVVGGKHLPRYLGAFAWRFNRRFVLKTPENDPRAPRHRGNDDPADALPAPQTG
jgi:hypothetical protein